MSDPVTVLVWRDAKNDPPVNEWMAGTGPKVTNLRTAYWRKSTREWCCEVDGRPLDPQPTLWADVVPPAADALTTDDVEVLTAMPGASTHTPGGRVMVAFTHHSMVAWHRAAARLRRAIEETTHE